MKQYILTIALVAISTICAAGNNTVANETKNNVEIVDVKTGNFVYYRSNQNPKYKDRIDTIWVVRVNGYTAQIDNWDGYGYHTDKWINGLTRVNHVNVLPLSLPESMKNVTIRMDYIKILDENRILCSLGSHWSSEKDGACAFIYNQQTGETIYDVDTTEYENIPTHVRFDQWNMNGGYYSTIVRKVDGTAQLGYLWW